METLSFYPLFNLFTSIRWKEKKKKKLMGTNICGSNH